MRRHTFSILAVLVVLSTVLAACAPATTSASPTSSPQSKPTGLSAGSVQLNGAGATFPEPIYKEWVFLYASVDPSVSINYQAIGSGGGKKAIVDNTVDFAGSDSLLSDAEYTAGKDLQMLPTLAGAVVPVYNIEGLKAEDAVLILDRPTLVGIYNATIKKWNDPAIVKLNPDLAARLPDKNITAVHRSDGSGTTEIFTRALSAFDENWKSNVGAGSAIEWPVDKAGNGIGGKGNAGVAASVQNTPNSIGYVELSYAVANKIPFASLVNKAGKVVRASNESTQAAMTDFAAAFDSKLTANIVDASGEKSWPIAGYTYLVIRMKSIADCTKGQKLLEFINWALTDANAAKRAAELGYSPLPEAVRKLAVARLAEVTCKDQSVLKK